MLSLAKRLRSYAPSLRAGPDQLRWARTDAGPPRRRTRSSALAMRKTEEKSEWWIVDGEMHEIGDHVPPRERFVIPRDNIPNKRRKQLREQFMRRTRLVLKESEHEPWCKRYMELYQELRENWERLYWDEGYSKKIAQDHANYESEDDDQDFSPYRNQRSNTERRKYQEGMKFLDKFSFVSPFITCQICLDLKDCRMFSCSLDCYNLFMPDAITKLNGFYLQDWSSGNRQGDTWERVNQIRDKFEFDREKRMRDKAFAPMHGGPVSDLRDLSSQNRPIDAERYFSESESESEEKENY
ncbi:hypothetical protein FNV43_RR22988 [Rhamnella rubrinervis]|uniref:Uncharacterized protein n=1 Tax=Rhamnella rubrinervis TaxID=2594499 RepID=A0A8K0GSJ2_9ROSA|nr:hypothetical protein FNV43_RR22988 [Rhamnella rubrinervis]